MTVKEKFMKSMDNLQLNVNEVLGCYYYLIENDTDKEEVKKLKAYFKDLAKIMIKGFKGVIEDE